MLRFRRVIACPRVLSEPFSFFGTALSTEPRTKPPPRLPVGTHHTVLSRLMRGARRWPRGTFPRARGGKQIWEVLESEPRTEWFLPRPALFLNILLYSGPDIFFSKGNRKLSFSLRKCIFVYLPLCYLRILQALRSHRAGFCWMNLVDN